MKKLYILSTLILALLATNLNAQWFSQDTTLVEGGNYSSAGWGAGVKVTIPAGDSVVIGGTFAGGKLIVNGILTLTSSFQINGYLRLGANAKLYSKGKLTTGDSVTISSGSFVNIDGDYSPNLVAGKYIKIQSNVLMTVAGTTTLNGGQLMLAEGATLNTNTFNLNNPNNFINGTINNSGTLTLSNGPNTLACPGKIITKDFQNDAAANVAIKGDGFIKVTGTFTSVNALTTDATIVLDAPNGLGDPGAATSNSPQATNFTPNPTNPCSTTVPVRLLGLQAQKMGKTIEIGWQTVFENNNAGFEIERSIDGKQFSRIGFVNSKANNGNSNYAIQYVFVDNDPLVGANIYRLKQLNNTNSEFVYFFIPQTIYFNYSALSIAPNPVKNVLHIKGIKNAKFYVYNIAGQLLINTTNKDIDVSGLAKGNYVIQIMLNNKSIATQQFIKF